MKYTYMAGFAICALSQMTLANNQQAPTENTAPPSISHTLIANIAHIGLDSKTATAEGIEDSATVLRLGWEGQMNNWLFGGGLGFLIYSDNESFSQTTRDTFGDVDDSDSSADALTLYGEAGYSFPFGSGFSFDLAAGVEVITGSKRSIANCRDCRSEDIEIDGGFYIAPELSYTNNGKYKFSLSYQNYLSGDLESGIALTLGYTL